MKCSECHKTIWFWQDSFKRVKNILSKEKPLQVFYYHSKCKEFGCW